MEYYCTVGPAAALQVLFLSEELIGMITAKAAAGFQDIIIGTIRYRNKETWSGPELPAKAPEEELRRFEAARTRVKEQHLALYRQAVSAAGKEYAEIFRLYAQILDDNGLLYRVKELITQNGNSAEQAVSSSMEGIRHRFDAAEDPYFFQRSADIEDLKTELLQNLAEAEDAEAASAEPAGGEAEKKMPEGGIILAAQSLTAAEILQLPEGSVRAILTKRVASLSHAAILAKSMGIPFLSGCLELSEEWNGKTAVLDGQENTVYVDPEPAFIRAMEEEEELRIRQREQLEALKGQPLVLKNGRNLPIRANIAVLQDLDRARENWAEGVGLFRSEFLYLNASAEPTEEEQYETYRCVVEAFAHQQVIIRTWDLGADKVSDDLFPEKEENPALGLRGVRLCLARRDFFKRQLRALLRAAVYGNLSIMLPMITSVWEVEECRKIIKECEEELTGQEVPHGEDLPVGVIIETPAAALCAEELAAVSDFFSVGTNDLTQYTCAADRLNPGLADYFAPHHPSVLRQLRMVAEAAHKYGITVSVCGEMAADPEMTEFLLEIGVDALSVSPEEILPLRGRILSLARAR